MTFASLNRDIDKVACSLSDGIDNYGVMTGVFVEADGIERKVNWRV